MPVLAPSHVSTFRPRSGPPELDAANGYVRVRGAMVRAWTVRGGQFGEREEQALDEGMVIAGWEEVGDLGGCSSIADLGDLLARAYPDEAPGTVDNWKH